MKPHTLKSLIAMGKRQLGGCLLWPGTKFASGYGRVYFQGKSWRLHRLVWHLAEGPIPPGLVVIHSCDTPACYERNHLRLGTNGDNQRDKWAKGRGVPDNGRYKRTEGHRAALRQKRRAESTSRYGQDVVRAGDVTDIPQRVPPSVRPGTPLLEKNCEWCGLSFLAPGSLVNNYKTCSRECALSSRRKSRGWTVPVALKKKAAVHAAG